MLRRFSSTSRPVITLARGDGIGPSLSDAVVHCLKASGAQLDIQEVSVGEQAYLAGHSSGIPPSAWDTIRRNKVLLKGPITTPQGSGYKSLNVSLRKTLGLYCNMRPVVAVSPAIPTRFPDMDVVIIRENEEDLYAGIEHRQTQQVIQCLKLITQPGCERIVRYAFDYAKKNNRKKVTCMVKDNIMKATDGLFTRVFREVGEQYPEIQQDVMIIDIGAARLANNPTAFDVIVTLNLYGDIISDIAAEISGSVGIGASANIGATHAMFEAVHGSAPTIAGKNIANPSGMLLSSVMMLNHLGQADVASRLHNAWLATVESGIRTVDIAESKDKAVGTREFAAAVAKNSELEMLPRVLKPLKYSGAALSPDSTSSRPSLFSDRAALPSAKLQKKELMGVDIFVEYTNGTPSDLANILTSSTTTCKDVGLKLITNRGVKVWPDGYPETFTVDHWRCRFRSMDNSPLPYAQVVKLLECLASRGVDVIKTENLYFFDGKPGFSMGQGE
ncbi:mitochondrial isocitrate dehydrogenase [Andalucia godoyi]|uniref:Isocitrate dehydrogenase [NADP] n=1 Tax=Andalucia godoyi TaxID=505711 RepID=A0A8K0F2A9_ANDGO|nr:mitochondrial isocitrate dehydrogenase [Andalucia godoyi]|eukprot:ANDGO_00656.mRNA.1 mitochondrial isocitrate dehydrogenase